MVEEGSGIHTKPQYMEKPPKMYDHIPTSDEVCRDMAPSTRFQYSNSNLNRLQKELEACQKEMEKAQEELKTLKDE
jgi:septation ring formation regulator EzrA